MSCFEPGFSTVRPTTVFFEPTVSSVMSQRTSMSTQPSSAARPVSGSTLPDETTYRDWLMTGSASLRCRPSGYSGRTFDVARSLTMNISVGVCDEEFLCGEFGEDLGAVVGDDDFFFDAGGGDAVGGGEVGFHREHHSG